MQTVLTIIEPDSFSAETYIDRRLVAVSQVTHDVRPFTCEDHLGLEGKVLDGLTSQAVIIHEAVVHRLRLGHENRANPLEIPDEGLI